MKVIKNFLENCSAAITAYEGPKDNSDTYFKKSDKKRDKIKKYIQDLLNMD